MARNRTVGSRSRSRSLKFRRRRRWCRRTVASGGRRGAAASQAAVCPAACVGVASRRIRPSRGGRPRTFHFAATAARPPPPRGDVTRRGAAWRPGPPSTRPKPRLGGDSGRRCARGPPVCLVRFSVVVVVVCVRVCVRVRVRVFGHGSCVSRYARRRVVASLANSARSASDRAIGAPRSPPAAVATATAQAATFAPALRTTLGCRLSAANTGRRRATAAALRDGGHALSMKAKLRIPAWPVLFAVSRVARSRAVAFVPTRPYA